MVIKIGMLYDERVPFGRDVEEINRRWAERHNYAFVSQQAMPDPSLDPYWNRLVFIKENLAGCDWFLWMDADAIIVNPERTLELADDHNVLFSQDYNGLCCGVFAVRNCHWSLRLLDAWLLVGSVGPAVWGLFDTGFMREQTTIKTLLKLFPALRERVGRIPESVIQNMYSPFNREALAIHTWAGFTGPLLVSLVIQRLKESGYHQNIMQP